MIELAVLGLVADQDLHGYELKKQLAELLGPWSSVSFGSLYPALARLEKAGLIQAVEAGAEDDPAAPTIPMTGALSGELAAFRARRGSAPKAPRTKSIGRRGKKVYGITPAGRARVHELLTAPGPDDERSFAVRVAFCQQLAPAERLALFERRKAELTAMLDSRRSTLAAASARRADPYRRLLRDRDTRSLTSDLVWIDELVAATAGSLASGVIRAPVADAPTTPARRAVEPDLSPPTLPRPPFSGSIIDPSPKAGSQP
jgi:DNA-binding PadR family transcriptional regulator